MDCERNLIPRSRNDIRTMSEDDEDFDNEVNLFCGDEWFTNYEEEADRAAEEELHRSWDIDEELTIQIKHEIFG